MVVAGRWWDRVVTGVVVVGARGALPPGGLRASEQRPRGSQGRPWYCSAGVVSSFLLLL